jgi:hypothetical protein
VKSIHQLTTDDFARIDFLRESFRAGMRKRLELVGSWCTPVSDSDERQFIEDQYECYAHLDKLLKMTDTELYNLYIEPDEQTVPRVP